MSQIDDLYTAQNELLFNMLFRHQVYLEGWKTSLADGYKQLLRKLYGEFAVYLRQSRYQTLDQFSKLQLNAFIYRFKHLQGKFYSTYTDELIGLLQQFVSDDVVIQKQIMLKATGKDIAQAATPLPAQITLDAYDRLDPAFQRDYVQVYAQYNLSPQYIANQDASGIYGIAAVDGSEDAYKQLWANIRNSPIPANGLLLERMIIAFGLAAATNITALITKGYANSWTINELEVALLGKNASYDGGLFATLLNQQTAIVHTAVQHVAAETQAAVASVYFEQYQWVSILDNKTTVICIERNGTVYVYGSGPLPPAHYFCRSKAVPVARGTYEHAVPPTFADWLVTQPVSFLEDVLDAGKMADLRAGKLSSIDFTIISAIKPLTIDEFTGKVKDILGE